MNEGPISHVALVCFVADPFDPPGFERYGGGHLFIFDLGRYLVQNGFQITFITRLNDRRKSPLELLGPHCSICRLEVGPPEEIAPAAVGEYLEELSESFGERVAAHNLKLDAIHSHYWIAGEVARRFCSSRQIRHVHSVLSLGRLKPSEGQSQLRDECEVRVFNSADALVTVCDAEYSDLERLYPEVSLTNTSVIPYGVDPDVFYIRPQSERDFVCRQARGFEQGTGGAPRRS